MKLKDYMERLKSENEIIYISTGQCWMFCGTKPEYEKYIGELNEEMKRGLVAAVESAKRKIEVYFAPDKKGRGAVKRTKEDEDVILARYKHGLEVAQGNLDAYVDIWDRDIVKTFKKDPLYPGTAVIVKGNRRVKGAFWSRDEFEQWINRKEGKRIHPRVKRDLCGELEPYRNLGVAVVETAVKDYRSLRDWLREHPTGANRPMSESVKKSRKRALRELKALEEFFEGEMIMMMTGVDGRRILDHLREENNGAV